MRDAHVGRHLCEGEILLVSAHITVDQAVGAEVFDALYVVVKDARVFRIVMQGLRQEVLGAEAESKADRR